MTGEPPPGEPGTAGSPSPRTTSAGEHGWGGAATTMFWVDPINDLVGVLMSAPMLAPNTPELELRTIVQAALAQRTDRSHSRS